MNLFETVYNVLSGNSYTEEDSKVLEAFLGLSESEIEKHIESADASILEDIAYLSEEDIEIFEEISDEDIEEVAVGQMSKRGIAASLIFGGPAGVVLYALYKSIKKRSEAMRLKCDKLTGGDKAECMFKARSKELEAKKAAVKKAAGKEADPKKKKKVMKKAGEQLGKLDKQLKDLKKREFQFDR